MTRPVRTWVPALLVCAAAGFGHGVHAAEQPMPAAGAFATATPLGALP